MVRNARRSAPAFLTLLLCGSIAAPAAAQSIERNLPPPPEAVAQLETAATAAVPVLDGEAATAAALIPAVGPLLAAAITAGDPHFPGSR